MVVKDRFSKPLKREFAPNKRPKPEDRTKVTVVEKESEYNVEVCKWVYDKNGKEIAYDPRIRVKKPH